MKSFRLGDSDCSYITPQTPLRYKEFSASWLVILGFGNQESTKLEKAGIYPLMLYDQIHLILLIISEPPSNNTSRTTDNTIHISLCESFKNLP